MKNPGKGSMGSCVPIMRSTMQNHGGAGYAAALSGMVCIVADNEHGSCERNEAMVRALACLPAQHTPVPSELCHK